MPFSPWSVERWRLGGVIVCALIIGAVSGYWTLAVLLPSALYIGWLLYQIYRLEVWICKGLKKRYAPEASGIWAQIVQLLYRTHRKEKGRKRRLAEMAARSSATTSALPYATVILSASNEVEWSNPAASRLLGVDRNRDTGQRIDNLIRNPAFQTLLQQSGSDPDLGYGSSDEDLIEIPSPLDSEITLSLRKVRFGRGQALITARDISKSVALQRTRKSFIANASHELRTPLTVILGYLEDLTDDSERTHDKTGASNSAPVLPVYMQTALKRSYRQALRMREIIEDLLTLSRLESTTRLGGPLPDPISMSSILKEVRHDLIKTRPDAPDLLTVDSDPELLIAARDTDLRSLLQNLVGNAFHHNPEGTRVKVRWYTPDDQSAVLEVRDDGVGIDGRHLARLTERFYRVDNPHTQKSGGTGLGLAIVNQIVSGLDGELEIQSTVGEGTQFRLSLPPHRIRLRSKPVLHAVAS